LSHVEPFGSRDDGGVRDAEWQVRVLPSELGDSVPVVRHGVFDDELTLRHGIQKRDLGHRTDARLNQIADFGNHKARNDDIALCTRQETSRTDCDGRLSC